MLNPLGTMMVLTIVFSQLFHKVAGYPVYLLSGLIAWQFFSQTTTAAMSQTTWGSVLLGRIYLPRTIFVVATVGTSLINFFISLIPLMLIMILIGFPFHLRLLFLPLNIALLSAFSLGVGLLLSTWAIYFPDVAEMYRVILVAWLYLTPVIYPQEILPEAYRYWLLHLNPMYYFIEIFRRAVYGGQAISWPLIISVTSLGIVFLTAGWYTFCSKADEFTRRV